MTQFKNVFLKLGLFLLVILMSNNLNAQSMESHILYDKSMKKTKVKKLLKAVREADVVFFGEMHNDPISHWLEFEILRHLHKNGGVVLGMEMFERDNQDVLSDYVQDTMSSDTFANKARLWKNYNTDYRPSVDYAKEHGINVVATNVPRIYASMIYKGGFEVLDTISEMEKSYMAPLPFPYDPELPSYVAMMEMMPGHGGENLPKAQAIKDATMAYSIAETYEEGKTYLHFNGSYHSDDYEGILWYLNLYKPGLKMITITVQEEDPGNESSLKGKADFIIVVNKNMTKTY